MRVLVADDDAVSLRLLEASLRRWGYDVLTATDGLEASAVLLSPESPKLVIVDWLMPGLDGRQLCQDIRRNKPEPYTYIIMLTSKRDRGDVIKGLEAGADDYVMKPFDPAELKVRLRTGKRILYLQEQLINAREALRDQAMRDTLTGLWNRGAILNILGDELERIRREGASLGIAMADVDYFKRVNDTYGHGAGDEVLRKIAQTMEGAVRRYDSIGRFGGEEFLIVLPGCDASNASSHAERLRTAIEALVLPVFDGEIRPTISLGVAVADNHCRLDACNLIQVADVALYRAKRAGRNCVVLGTAASCEPAALAEPPGA